MASISSGKLGMGLAVMLVLVVCWTQTVSGESKIEFIKKDLVHQSSPSSSDLESTNSKLKENAFMRALVARYILRQLNDEYRLAGSKGQEDREKKSVMLPRIGRRSPIVKPRMGSLKRSIYNPRIGRRLYEQEDSNESSLLSLGDDDGANEYNSEERFEDKRAIVNPRIGK